MLKVFVGHSEDILAAEATREAIAQLQSALAGAQPQAGLLFCSVDLDHALILSAIRAAFPAIELAGCTTDGELSSGLGFTEDSLALLVFVADDIEIRAGFGREAARHGKAAGYEAAAAARAAMVRQAGEEQFAVLLCDALNAGNSGVDKGIRDVLGHTFPVVGGAAAAHSKQRQTFQFCNGEVLTDSVVLLLFAGPVVFSCGLQGGFSPLAPRAQVTKSAGNVLYEIDGKPAYEYFRTNIGNYDLFVNYCLAVYEKGSDCFYVRSAPFSDPEKGTVTLNGCLAAGSTIQIGTANRKAVVESCSDSIRRALREYPGSHPAAAMFFSCAGRKMIMGTRIVLEAHTVRQLLPGIPFAGYYCYGEFGPLERGAPYMFHGTTFVTLLLGPGQEGQK